jgi:N-glycosidase YbiA
MHRRRIIMEAMRPVLVFIVALAAGCAVSPPPPARIDSFQGQYRFLSNFWPAQVEFEGLVYPDVEHAYQSAKTLDMTERRRIAALPTPAEAKRAGEALPLRPDWLKIKYDVMLQCVRYKFTHHPELASQLLATGDAYLEEGNTWNDQIWGVFEGKGTNWLGKILMQVRGELRASHAE